MDRDGNGYEFGLQVLPKSSDVETNGPLGHVTDLDIDFSSDNSRIFHTKLSIRIEREIHKSTKLVPTHTLTDHLVMKICHRVANQ